MQVLKLKFLPRYSAVISSDHSMQDLENLMEDKLLDENDTKVLINLSISMNEHVCLSVCMFAIGRNTVGGRKKHKRPYDVKSSVDYILFLYLL